MNSGKNIFIIGMPGSGKSTIGKLLAASLNLTFFDLDDEIERDSKKSVADIFSSAGEDKFRSLENDIFQKIMSRDEQFVMSTGGGTPCFYDNIKKMNISGSTIYLDVPIEVLISRIKKNNERPLLKNNPVESLENLYSSRRKCYEQATYVMESTETGVDRVVDSIVRLLQ